jgi:hypothetical protein
MDDSPILANTRNDACGVGPQTPRADGGRHESCIMSSSPPCGLALRAAASMRRGAQADMSVISPVLWSPVFWACCLISSRILSITLVGGTHRLELILGDAELAHHLRLQTLRPASCWRSP